jgi:hypothetical protein
MLCFESKTVPSPELNKRPIPPRFALLLPVQFEKDMIQITETARPAASVCNGRGGGIERGYCELAISIGAH